MKKAPKKGRPFYRTIKSIWTQFLKFREQNRERLIAGFTVELEGDLDPVTSQAEGYRQFSLIRIDMRDGAGDGDDAISDLVPGGRS